MSRTLRNAITNVIYHQREQSPASKHWLKAMALIPFLAAVPASNVVAQAQSLALEEIVVTARRRDESLQDVPVTVNVVSSEMIEDMNIRRFEDLEQLVAGLELEDRAVGPLAQMRGVRFDAFASGSNSSVEFYQNDALITSNIAMQSMFDVGMVEVLRGPQGTLRGKASPSGAIIMTTKRPDFETVNGYVDITGTDEGGENLTAAINVPLIDDMLAVRLAYYNEENRIDHVRSFRTGERAKMESDAWRLSVRFEPTDNLAINAYYQDLNTDRWNFVAVESANINDPSLPAGSMYIEDTDRLSAQFFPSTNFTEAERTGLEVEWDLGAVTLNYSGALTDSGFVNQSGGTTSGFYDATYPVALQNFYGQGVLNEGEQEVHELRLSGDITEELSYTAGAFYTDFWSDSFVSAYTALFNFGTAPANFVTILETPVLSKNESQEKSYFGNLTYQFSDRTELSAGLRYIDFALDQRTTISGAPLGGLTDDYTTTIYTVSLAHNFTDDIMGYITAGSSWRPGNSRVGNSDTERTDLEKSLLDIGPEESDSIEFGVKSTFMDDRLRLNATVFYQTFDDYPLLGDPVFFVNTGNDGFQSVSSFGFLAPVELETYGLELDGQFQITDNWTFGGTFSWAQGTTDGDIACNDYFPTDGVPDSSTANPPVTVGQIRAATGGDDIATCSVSQRSYDSPTWTTSLNTEYSFPVTDQFNGYVRLKANIYGNSKGSPTNPNDQVDSYSVFDLFAGLRSDEFNWGSWEAMLFVKNIFETEETTSYGINPVRTSVRTFFGVTDIDSEYRTATVTKPREIGLNLRYNF